MYIGTTNHKRWVSEIKDNNDTTNRTEVVK